MKYNNTLIVILPLILISNVYSMESPQKKAKIDTVSNAHPKQHPSITERIFGFQGTNEKEIFIKNPGLNTLRTLGIQTFEEKNKEKKANLKKLFDRQYEQITNSEKGNATVLYYASKLNNSVTKQYNSRRRL